MVAARVGVKRPVALDIVPIAILIVDARRHRPLVGDRPDGSEANQNGVIVIRLALVDGKSRRIDSVNPSAVMPIPNTDTRP